MARSILMVGGGSGGHFYPLMGIAEALRARDQSMKLYYAGPESYDSDALSRLGIRFVWCPAGKWRKYASLRNGIDLIKTIFGIFVALIQLYVIYPDVVVSKGGYTSVPIVLAAWFYRIPIFVHESDAVMGSANKLALHLARVIAVSYPELVQKLSRENVFYTGIPIRNELRKPIRPQAHAELGIENDYPVILVLGGSQGAERVNALILESLDNLLPAYNVIHQTGEKHFSVTALSARELITDPELLTRYRPIAFLDAELLNDVLHVASVVVSRAGSGSIHEIAVHGKPAVLIPIPEEVSHDQRTNAFAYAGTGAAIVLEEHNLTGTLLRSEIDRIMQDQSLYEHMASAARGFATVDAADVIAQTLVEISETH